jgi:hypothetical protein
MRAALGVIVAFVAMAVMILVVSLAPWFVLGVDGVLQPGRFESTMGFNVYAVAVGGLGAVVAGWICAAIGRSRGAVLVLAVLCFANGIANHVGQHHKPEPGAREPGVSVMDAVSARKEPDWFTVLMPCLGVVGVCAGGLILGANRISAGGKIPA